MKATFSELIRASITTKQALLADQALLTRLEAVTQTITETFRNKGKVLFCGNGGSAADAQHIAAELSGRFYKDRPPLFAEALHVNTSYVTAVANDYGYEEIYARMTEAMGREGDVLIGISTSGNSPNVLKAVQKARAIGMKTVALTGDSGGKLRQEADFLLNVPSADTPRIQEAHILIGHMICQEVERLLFE